MIVKNYSLNKNNVIYPVYIPYICLSHVPLWWLFNFMLSTYPNNKVNLTNNNHTKLLIKVTILN